MPLPKDQQTILHSWNEIAAYVARGIRTVQRWERDINFPIHRNKQDVFAVSTEIDEWLRDSACKSMQL
jgi:hypothetical protein